MQSKTPRKPFARVFALLLPVVFIGVLSTGCHHEREPHDDPHRFEHHDDFRPGPGPGGY